jgi:hypothetical protein
MKLLQDALDKWGFHAQLIHAVEEASEFTTAFFQWERDQENITKRHHLVEEVVDNYLMMRQMALAFKDDPMWDIMMKTKTKKLRDRLREDPKPSGKTFGELIEDVGEESEWKKPGKIK